MATALPNPPIAACHKFLTRATVWPLIGPSVATAFLRGASFAAPCLPCAALWPGKACASGAIGVVQASAQPQSATHRARR